MKVLIVDDDKSILDVLKLFLSELHDVKLFNNPQRAFDTYINYVDFDVVITDFYLPGIRGDEFIQKILSINPNQQIILCSGTPSVDMDLLIDKYSSSIKYVKKPFDLEDILNSINSVEENI